MKSDVDFKSTGPRVALVTRFEGASERFLAGMRKLVCLQVTLGNELRLAYVTSEGSFTCVRPHVGFQVARLSEFFQTLLIGTNQYFGLVFRPGYLLDVLVAQVFIEVDVLVTCVG